MMSSWICKTGRRFIGAGKVRYWNHGWRNKERLRPVRETDFFETDSVGKVFTSVLFAKLIIDGLCSEDDAIQKFVPEVPRSLHLNLRQLLTHTSGLPNDPPNFISIAPKNSFIADNDEDLISALKATYAFRLSEMVLRPLDSESASPGKEASQHIRVLGS